MKLDGAPIRGNTNKDEFDIRGGANKKLTYTGKRQFRGFETSVVYVFLNYKEHLINQLKPYWDEKPS